MPGPSEAKCIVKDLLAPLVEELQSFDNTYIVCICNTCIYIYPHKKNTFHRTIHCKNKHNNNTVQLLIGKLQTVILTVSRL